MTSMFAGAGFSSIRAEVDRRPAGLSPVAEKPFRGLEVAIADHALVFAEIDTIPRPPHLEIEY